MNKKDKLLELVKIKISRSLEERYTEAHDKHTQTYASSENFSKKVNTYISDLTFSIAKEKYEEHKEKVIEIIINEINKVMSELFSDDEVDMLYAFATSTAGSKFIRNLDLFKDAFNTGHSILTTELIAAWSDPSVNKKISNFIESLSDDEEFEDGELDEDGDSEDK
jgi:hypothetical protein